MPYSHVRSFICFLKKKQVYGWPGCPKNVVRGKYFSPVRTMLPQFQATTLEYLAFDYWIIQVLACLNLSKNRGWREMKLEYIILAIVSAIIRTVYVFCAIAFMVFEESCWKGRIGSHLRFLRPSLTILRLSIPPKNFVAWCIWNNKHWQIQIQLSLWWWPAASDCRSKKIRKFFR